MRSLARVSKGVKFHSGYLPLPEQETDSNSSVVCKFGYVLHVFPLCFTQCHIKKYKQKQNKRITEKQVQKKTKTIFVWLLCDLIKVPLVENCTSADRITSETLPVSFKC